jgi:hypothetical protein
VAILAVTESEPIAMALAFAVALSARAAGIVFGLSLPRYGKER